MVFKKRQGVDRMIQITVPKFELTVKFDELHKIPKGAAGVYVLYNTEEKPLYVGVTNNLFNRLNLHFLGVSNTSRYKGKFYKASMFFEPIELNRRIYEIYMIAELKTEANIAEKRFVMEDSIIHSLRCNFIKNNGVQCKNKPHTNGYCRFHGGNGISRAKMVQKAVADYENKIKSNIE